LKYINLPVIGIHHFVFIGAPLGEMVLTVTAVDLDKDANLKYSIIEPIRAWNRINMEISNNPYKVRPDVIGSRISFNV